MFFFFWMFSRERNPSDLTCLSRLTDFASKMYLFWQKRSQQWIKLWLDLPIKWNSSKIKLSDVHFLALFFYYFSTKNKQEKRQSKAKQNNKPNQTKPNQTKTKKQKTKHKQKTKQNSQKKNWDPKYKFMSFDVSLNYERTALEK